MCLPRASEFKGLIWERQIKGPRGRDANEPVVLDRG